MTQIETESQRARSSKRVISLGRVAVAGLACLPLLLFALGFARFSASQKAIAGLSLAGVKVAGGSSDEVERRLAERALVLAKQKLRVQLAGRENSLTIEELGIELSVTDSASRALSIGRSAGALPNALRYLRSYWWQENLAAVLRVDPNRFAIAMDRLGARLISDPPFAGGIAMTAGVPRPLPARAGRKIAAVAARLAIERTVALGQTSPVALPVETVTPKLAASALDRAVAVAARVVGRPVRLLSGERRLEVSAAALQTFLVSRAGQEDLELSFEPARVEAWLEARRQELEAPPRDAGFEVSPRGEVKVVPGEAGVRLVAADVASALWVAATDDDRQAELPLLREPRPARSTEQAEQLGIRRLVGSFATRHPCCQPRVDNIHRLAELLDGLVVEPGQTVSVNAIVGPRTQKNGFVLAPSIEDGEMVDTVGGGVSQFATTFFNALFHAGYDIIERQPHSYWFPRYPMGHEATLSWPKPDIVFKNDSQAGLLVKTSFTATTISVRLYGDTGGRKVTSSVSERREVVRPAVELLPNREIAPDEEKVKEGGMIGWSVIASRTVTFADGTKKEERRKVTYKPKTRRVEMHPCRIPDGEPGATGERCPEPEDAEVPAGGPAVHSE